MKTVCEVLGVARSNITVRARAPVAKPLGRPPQPDADLVDEIKAVIGEMPTYGYRRVWAVLRRAAKAQGHQPPNHKRIYRVMKAHGLLLQRYAGGA
jgi:putative transposase